MKCVIVWIITKQKSFRKQFMWMKGLCAGWVFPITKRFSLRFWASLKGFCVNIKKLCQLSSATGGFRLKDHCILQKIN